jgi:hypothetical protein
MNILIVLLVKDKLLKVYYEIRLFLSIKNTVEELKILFHKI